LITYTCAFLRYWTGVQSDGDRKNLQEGANLPGVVRTTIEDAVSGEDTESDNEDDE
jgi:hypothetical protein